MVVRLGMGLNRLRIRSSVGICENGRPSTLGFWIFLFRSVTANFSRKIPFPKLLWWWVVRNVLNILKVALPTTLAEFSCYFFEVCELEKGGSLCGKKTDFGEHGSKPLVCITLAKFLTI